MMKRGVSLEQRIEDGAPSTDLGGGDSEVLHISRDTPSHVAVKPLNPNKIKFEALTIGNVCDNQCATARKLLILKTERCPSG